MKRVTIVRDMFFRDLGEEGEGRVVAIFAKKDDALKTRKLLEGRTHPDHALGYRYHFEIEECVVHESALTEADIAREYLRRGGVQA